MVLSVEEHAKSYKESMNEFESRLSQPLLKRISELLPADIPIYLVGGAIRDALLDRPSYDLDFVTGGEALRIARGIANQLNAAYFPLDPKRKVARIILPPAEQVRWTGNRPARIDFSVFQGKDLEEDLRGRDFTFNAMAVEVRDLGSLIDPLGGASDLLGRRLRACSATSFVNDPVRILRAARFAVDLNMKVSAETTGWLREAVGKLDSVSAERIRDELFRILVLRHPSTALRLLDQVGALDQILPEVCALKGVSQSAPHILDAWDHTLDTLSRLESVLEVLKPEFDPDKAGNLSLGLVVLQLGQFRGKLAEHLASALNVERPHRGLLFLAALYHDVGKRETRSEQDGGKVRFLGHDQAGARQAKKRALALKLSKTECDRLACIVSQHMRPSLLSHTEELPSRKAVYHFFRDSGAAGVDICILSLADMLATYGATLPQDRWARHLEVVRTLLDAWWEGRQERVLPAMVINGDELMEALALPPGPTVGYLLEAIREAQISHEVTNRQEAISLAKSLMVGEEIKKTG